MRIALITWRYVSHFWGQACMELLKILKHFRSSLEDPAFWICTLANNQHRVDLGSHWKKSPFYRGMCGLKATGGSVLMAMDAVASTLTRQETEIYEVFLVVSSSLLALIVHYCYLLLLLSLWSVVWEVIEPCYSVCSSCCYRFRGSGVSSRSTSVQS